MSFSYLMKYIIIGDTNVGKSCLLLQFIDHKFRSKYEPTIGVQFGAKTIHIKDQAIKIQVWDTAGQQSFLSITRGYYRSAIGAIVVYDITKKQSFIHVQNWINEAKTHGRGHMVFMLVGNKCDLQSQREVSFQEGQKLAKEYGIAFLETSAKTSHNSAKSIIQKVDKGQIDLTKNIIGIRKGGYEQKSHNSLEVISPEVQKNKKTCC